MPESQGLEVFVKETKELYFNINASLTDYQVFHVEPIPIDEKLASLVYLIGKVFYDEESKAVTKIDFKLKHVDIRTQKMFVHEAILMPRNDVTGYHTVYDIFYHLKRCKPDAPVISNGSLKKPIPLEKPNDILLNFVSGDEKVPGQIDILSRTRICRFRFFEG